VDGRGSRTAVGIIGQVGFCDFSGKRELEIKMNINQGIMIRAELSTLQLNFHLPFPFDPAGA
jgi:hypothetical protein